MLITAFLLSIIIILLIMLTFVWPPDSPWAPRWRTRRGVARKALKLAALTPKDKLYELGCGDGEVIVSAAQDFGAHAVGIEIDPTRFWVSKFRVWKNELSKKVSVVRKDFKKVNLSSATVVYMYLVPAAMKRNLPKLKKELRPGTKILSYRYKIPLDKNERNIVFEDQDKRAKVYLYLVKSTGKD
jgi:hypothetical protein